MKKIMKSAKTPPAQVGKGAPMPAKAGKGHLKTPGVKKK